MEALQWMARDLESRGVETARLDAEVLLADAIGTTRMGLYLAYERPLSTSERAALRSRIERRRTGEPVAYILGVREFYGLALAVDRRVLVPRPETELVVDAVLEALPEHGVGGCVLDLGTGSGAIAIAVARARPTAIVDAVDASADALEVARANRIRHTALGVRLREGDLFAPLSPDARYDVIVSNPPYIARADLAALPVDVRDFEPRIALEGGDDGLSIVRRIVAEAPRRLARAGTLVLELGFGQASAVRALFGDAGLGAISVRRDYAGIERVLVGRLG